MAKAEKKRASRGRGPAGGSRSQRSGSRAARSAGKGVSKNAPQSSLFLPLLAVWFIALVVLASLLYWGRGPYGGLWKGSRPAGPTGQEVTVKGNAAPVAVPKAERTPSSAPKQDVPSPAARTAPDGAQKLASVGPGTLPKPSPPPEILPPSKPPVAQVALVIDDFGRDLPVAKRFLNLPIPITFSIIPGLKHSREIAELATVHGHEVIIHMPMEPEGYPKVNPGPMALLVSMSRDRIEQRLSDAIRQNPYARGMNNHMGSRFTSSEKQMEWTLRYLESRGFYFMDSYTIARSVGERVARRLGVPTIKRDIFLDHEQTESFVRKQLKELVKRAKIQGHAVAIGHPYPVTLKVLGEQWATLEQEGIEVVPLCRLVTGGSGCGTVGLGKEGGTLDKR